MPSKSLVCRGEQRAKNFKKAKERVTLLGCANASGTCRLPLAFINKSAKPRCFKNMDMNNLPVHYFSQQKSWMDARLFTDWFHHKFVPRVKRFCEENVIEYKILLLLDNAPAHPSIEVLQSRDGCVTTMFLPPNTTSLMQPMDQAVLDPLKRRYKKHLLRHIILENESSSLSITDILKNVTIKNAVYWAAQSWNETSNQSLRKAWKVLLPSDSTCGSAIDDSEDASEDSDVRTLFNDLGYVEGDPSWQHPEEWLSEDVDDPGHQILSDAEIIATVADEISDHSSDSNEGAEIQRSAKVTHSQAYDALATVLEWLEEQDNVTLEHLLLVKKWRDLAANRRRQSQIQTRIGSFFPRTEP